MLVHYDSNEAGSFWVSTAHRAVDYRDGVKTDTVAIGSHSFISESCVASVTHTIRIKVRWLNGPSKSKDGQYHAMSHFGVITYWFYRGLQPGEEPPELPSDFRMVGGSPMRTSYNESDPAHRAISFQCFGPGYDCESAFLESESLGVGLSFLRVALIH